MPTARAVPYIALLVPFGCLLGLQAQQSDADARTAAQFVAAAVMNARTAMPSVALRWTFTQELDAGHRAKVQAAVSGDSAGSAEQVPAVSIEPGRWYYGNPVSCLVLDGEKRSPGGGTVLTSQRLVWDDVALRTLDHYVDPVVGDEQQKPRSRWRGQVLSSAEAAPHGLPVWFEKKDPRYWMFYSEWGKPKPPVDSFLLENLDRLVEYRHDAATGEHTLLVSLPTPDDRAELVVGEQQDWLVTRWTLLHRLDDKWIVTSERRVEETQEAAGRCWPRRCTSRMYFYRDGVSTQTSLQVYECEVLAGGAPPPELLELNWPIGARVEDRRTGQRATVQLVSPDHGSRRPTDGVEARE